MRKYGVRRIFLSQFEVHEAAVRHHLRFAIVRPRGARAGEGFATILRTYDTKGRPIQRDISRIEVSEADFIMFLAHVETLGVYRYEGDSEEWIHVGYLPGCRPRGLKPLRSRLRRRRLALTTGLSYSQRRRRKYRPSAS